MLGRMDQEGCKELRGSWRLTSLKAWLITLHTSAGTPLRLGVYDRAWLSLQPSLSSFRLLMLLAGKTVVHKAGTNPVSN